MRLITNSFLVSGFMVEGLGLSGNELMVYAIVYGFTQDGEWHPVRLNYLSRWINRSRPDVIRLLKGLKEKGLIESRKSGRENLYRIRQEPIDEIAQALSQSQEEEKRRKSERGPSPWEKALEKARGKAPEGEAAGEGKAEDLKALGDELRSFDPYGFGKED